MDDQPCIPGSSSVNGPIPSKLARSHPRGRREVPELQEAQEVTKFTSSPLTDGYRNIKQLLK